jgi:Glycosyltransferase family 92
MGSRPYLAVCVIYNNEGPYIREWIEFHRLFGVERFFLYDHGSTDEHMEALAPYLDDGLAVVHDWPIDPGQLEAYEHCLDAHANDARWIAFIDLDEFLFSPTGRPLPEILADYERWPAVVVNRATYGTSGHATRPDGLVIESYVLRALDDYPPNRTIKTIADPARTERAGVHLFSYSDGFAVDENQQRLDGAVTDALSLEKLRVNHYFTRSVEELRRKFKRVRADTALPKRPPDRPLNVEKMDSVLSKERDGVLVPYGPDVRRALEAVERRERGAVPAPPGEATSRRA